MKQLLLIPRLKIHNANALSSPYTIGFPAMSAWLGFMHNLQRQLTSDFQELKFEGIVVSCHEINLQTYKGKNDFNSSIIATGNPLDKNGKRPSFIEEARCDLEVSIAIEYQGLDQRNFDDFREKLITLIHKSKIASGDVINFNSEKIKPFKILEMKDFRAFIRHLMPGFCLVSRRDLMQQEMEQGQGAIDSLLESLKTTTTINIDKNAKIEKLFSRKESGWIVPIAVGYQGISELSSATNARDNTTPHRFAESVITLGEFIMPYRFNKIDEMLWRYKADLTNDLYLCDNQYPNFLTNQEESKL